MPWVKHFETTQSCLDWRSVTFGICRARFIRINDSVIDSKHAFSGTKSAVCLGGSCAVAAGNHNGRSIGTATGVTARPSKFDEIHHTLPKKDSHGGSYQLITLVPEVHEPSWPRQIVEKCVNSRTLIPDSFVMSRVTALEIKLPESEPRHRSHPLRQGVPPLVNGPPQWEPV